MKGKARCIRAWLTVLACSQSTEAPVTRGWKDNYTRRASDFHYCTTAGTPPHTGLQEIKPEGKYTGWQQKALMGIWLSIIENFLSDKSFVWMKERKDTWEMQGCLSMCVWERLLKIVLSFVEVTLPRTLVPVRLWWPCEWQSVVTCQQRPKLPLNIWPKPLCSDLREGLLIDVLTWTWCETSASQQPMFLLFLFFTNNRGRWKHVPSCSSTIRRLIFINLQSRLSPV